MAEPCKDIEAALARLEKKIDIQNACCAENKRAIKNLNDRIKNLEKNGSNKQGQNKNQDLTAINQRIAKIENYIIILDNSGKAIQQGLESIKKIFLGE